MRFFSVILLLTLIILVENNPAQNNNSIQVSGGMIMPMSSSKGVTASVQYNYQFNSSTQFYLYSGYSFWDKFFVSFIEEWSVVQDQTIFKSYSSDAHKMIPLYIGTRINFHTNKFFTSFVTFELGYSYLSYNTYKVVKITDANTGKILDYEADRTTKRSISENLIGIGGGIGLTHELMENLSVVLAFKLNSHLNSKYYDFLDSKGIYTAVVLGFDLNI
ncbi:MAG: hypothetical protein K9J16_15530 [Melioribacteraceae bacterium]|nr:hypothetical protein [Melioribacteraceae bacterium]MCF8393044.1 hypothetical protein [Melioribacteraceae bacterium]MCF8419103.1 hypothetical protein [Melioribacteraceae bacterium]